MSDLLGGIEAGGTKFVCAVGAAPDGVRAETHFPTTTPEETLHRAIQFFREWQRHEPLAAMGIASFGPIDLHADSPTFGYITTTPKPGWANTNLVGAIRDALRVPSLSTRTSTARRSPSTAGARVRD